MKIILVGANGTMGKHVNQMLALARHEVIRVGRASGDFQVKMENPQEVAQFYKKIGNFDAVVCTAGEVAFTPLLSIQDTEWHSSLQSKLMGQIHLVQQAIPYINERGSFTLISGVLGDEHIRAGTIAATVNSAVEGFVKAAACELSKGVRINGVSPTLLQDSVKDYESYFPGFIPVSGENVAQAFKKSILGIETGQIYRVR
jgi:NAD(P)-dependent dehydrogenase (short-subunit alcohol dehydrogenase family)